MLATLLLSFLSSAFPAQIVGGEWANLHEAAGPATSSLLGQAVAVLHDLDGDGIPEIAASAPHTGPFGPGDRGTVFVLSGASQSELYRIQGSQAGDRIGDCLAPIQDCDGDGIADFLIGSERARYDFGLVQLHSGADGSLLLEVTGPQRHASFGQTLAAAGDVDLDGVPDFYVGACSRDRPGITNGGALFLYSGASGSVLREWAGTSTEGSLGQAIVVPGDLDGDGVPDVVVSSPGSVWLADTDIWAFSPITGQVIYELNETTRWDAFGHALAVVPDQDGDGLQDLLVGAPQATGTAGTYAGRVDLCSSLDGATLASFEGLERRAQWGSELAYAGDVDGDGFADFLTANESALHWPVERPGGVAAVSLRQGELLQAWRGTQDREHFGSSVSGGADLDGDGRAEVLIGAPRWDDRASVNAGRVLTIGFRKFLEADGTEVTIPGGSVRFAVDFGRSEAGRGFAVLASASGTGPIALGEVSLPLTPDPVFYRLLQGSPPASFQGQRGVLDADGTAETIYSAPPHHSPLIGATIWFAALSFDAASGSPRKSSVAIPILMKS